MLTTQVQYWTYKENQRHNLVFEKETNRHNLVVENQNQQSINETIRHNVKTETQTDWMNLESKRHNLATEAIGRTQAAASMLGARAAMANAAASQYAAETGRMQLPIQRMQATSGAISAGANMQKANTEAYLASQKAPLIRAQTAGEIAARQQGWITSITRGIRDINSVWGE